MKKDWLSREQLAKMGADAQAFEERTDPFGFRIGGRGGSTSTTVRFELRPGEGATIGRAGSSRAENLSSPSSTGTSVVFIGRAAPERLAAAKRFIGEVVTARTAEPRRERISSNFPAAAER